MYSYEANGRGNTSATDAKLLERKSQFINLPAVTPEDNGKVLGVDKGKWQPVNGSDPAIASAKETGGFGWTEQGEQTTIEWDGDTTGKVVVDVGAVQFVKVADVPANFDPNSVTNIVDTTGEQTFEVNDMADEFGVIGYQTASNASLNVIVDFVKASEMGIEFTENGIYFQKGGFLGSGYITSLTYGTPDTVHKIDEKYISGGGGGAMEVKFTAVDDVLTCNHTYDEIAEAFPNIIVMAEHGSGRAVFPEMFINDEFFGATLIEVESNAGEIDSIFSTRYAISSDGVVTTYESEKFF